MDIFGSKWITPVFHLVIAAFGLMGWIFGVSHILSWQGSEGSRPRPMATVEDLNLALVSGSNDQLKEVLDSGIDPDAADVFGNTPLRSIIEQSGGVPASRGQVETLLAAGADPNLTDAYGDTPLHAAAYDSPEALISALLQAGGDPNLPNDVGVTAYETALKHGNHFGHRAGVTVPASRSGKAEGVGSLLPETPGLSRKGAARGSEAG